MTLLGDLGVSPLSPDATSSMETIWNIFYHTFIPDHDIRKLQDHAADLVAASESTSTWTDSRYAKYITFLSQITLRELRKFWQQYTATGKLSAEERSAFDQGMRNSIDRASKTSIGSDHVPTNGIRCAGAHYENACEAVRLSLQGYSSTGVICGNQADIRKLGENGKGRANPTFAFSSAPTKRYAVHYGINPVDSFHLAEVFDQGYRGDPAHEKMGFVAKAQFRTWCDAFVTTVKESRIKVILHYGDAISLCYKLQGQNFDRAGLSGFVPIFNAYWSAEALLLDGPAHMPENLRFEIIDTSNITDLVGILNVLPATVPLLSRKRFSVLYTETLLLQSGSSSNELEFNLCSDISTMSVLIGVSPTDHLLGHRTDSNMVETALQLLSQRYNRLRTSWRAPASGESEDCEDGDAGSLEFQSLWVDVEELNDFLAHLYAKMFAGDDLDALSTALKKIQLTASDLQTDPSVPSGNVNPYTASTFVAIICLISQTIDTDWRPCLDHTIRKLRVLENSSAVRGSVQETILYLHLSGMLEANQIMASIPRWAGNHSVLFPSSYSMATFDPLSSPVCRLAIAVPNDELQDFMPKLDYRLGNDPLHVSIHHVASGREDVYTSVNCFFGFLKAVGEADVHYAIEEDPLGWYGSSDLIVTCPVLSSSVLQGSIVEMSAAVTINPLGTYDGPDKTIYRCGLVNTEQVRFLRAPSNDGESLIARLKGTQRREPHISARLIGPKVLHLKTCDMIPKGSEQSKALSEKAGVVITQSSPCTMTVQIGNTVPRTLSFPYLINGSAAKTRIARASSWIEVSVPVSPTGVSAGYNISPSPAVQNGSIVSSWIIPRVNILQQPVVRLEGDLEWLEYHLSFPLSEEESSILQSHPRGSPTRPKNGLLDFKQTYNLVATSFAGINLLTLSKKYKAFFFHLNGKCEICVYINALRHDRNTASVFLDAWLLPTAHLRSPVARSEFLPVGISAEEAATWKQLMPSLVERCRHGWSHTPRCEYKATGRIPLSMAPGTLPICSCGHGKALDGYPKNNKRLKDLAKQATRIAILPIFPGPFSSRTVDAEVLEAIAMAEGKESEALPASRTEIPTHRPHKATKAIAVRKCHQCGAQKEGLMVCARCEAAWYCGKECQKAAWKEHKKKCKK